MCGFVADVSDLAVTLKGGLTAYTVMLCATQRRTDRLYRHASRDISFPAVTKQKWRQENARYAWFLTRTFDLLTLIW